MRVIGWILVILSLAGVVLKLYLLPTQDAPTLGVILSLVASVGVTLLVVDWELRRRAKPSEPEGTRVGCGLFSAETWDKFSRCQLPETFQHYVEHHLKGDVAVEGGVPCQKCQEYFTHLVVEDLKRQGLWDFENDCISSGTT